MPAPSTYEYTDALNVSAQTLTKNALEAGSGAGKLKIYSEADVLLGTITLTDPLPSVSASGVLTITAPTGSLGVADGTATWGEFTDSDDNRVLIAPAQQGSVAVDGVIVLNTTSVVNGAALEIVSASFGG